MSEKQNVHAVVRKPTGASSRSFRERHRGKAPGLPTPTSFRWIRRECCCRFPERSKQYDRGTQDQFSDHDSLCAVEQLTERSDADTGHWNVAEEEIVGEMLTAMILSAKVRS